MKTLFGLEDSTVKTGYEGDAEITVTDMIEAVGFEAEIAADVQSIEDSMALATQAEMISGQLEASIAADTATLESDSVTPSVAKMSHLQLEATAEILGLPAGTYTVSAESVETSPETVLKVSLEAKENMFKKVIETIKAVLSKAMTAVMKAGVKIVTAISNVEKSAKSLGDKLGSVDEAKKEELDDTEKEAIAKRFAANSVLIGGKKVNKDLLTKLTDKLAGSKNILASYGATLSGSNEAEVQSHFSKFVDSIKLNAVSSISVYVDGIDFGKAKADVVFVRGNSFKVAIADDKGNLTYVSKNAKADMYKSVKTETITASDLVNVLADLESVGKGTKELNDEVKKIDAETKKFVESIDKDADEKFVSVVKALAVISPKITLDALMFNYTAAKDILWLGNVILKKYKK